MNRQKLLLSGMLVSDIIMAYWLAKHPSHFLPAILAFLGFATFIGIHQNPLIWLVAVVSLTTMRLFDNFAGFWSISKILTLLAVSFLAMKSALRKTQIQFFRDLTVPIVFFLLWCICSLLWADYKAAALENVISFLSLSALFWLIYTLFRNQVKALYIGTYAIIMALAFSCFVWLYTTFVDPSLGLHLGLDMYSSTAYGTARFAGLNGDANGFALMLNYATLLTVMLLIGGTGKSGSRARTVFLLGLVLLFMLVLINTASRSAWGGLVVGGFCLTLASKSVHKRYVIVSAIILTLLVWIYRPLIVMRFEALGETAYGGRLPELQNAIRYFSDAPLYGIGIGNYKPTILEARLATGRLIAPSAAHNVFAKLLAETGLIGIFLYLWIWLAVLRLALRNERQARTKELYWLNRGFAACFSATFVSSFSQGISGFNLWWITLGLFAVLSSLISEQAMVAGQSEAELREGQISGTASPLRAKSFGASRF